MNPRNSPLVQGTFFSPINPRALAFWLEPAQAARLRRTHWDPARPDSPTVTDYRPRLLEFQKELRTRPELENVWAIPTEYFSRSSVGRIYPRGDFSPGPLPREIRASLTDEYLIDLDVENAHPTILLCVLESHGYPFAALARYCKYREQSLQEVVKAARLEEVAVQVGDRGISPYEAAKTLFLRLQFLGSLDGWLANPLQVNPPVPSPVSAEQLPLLVDYSRRFREVAAFFRDRVPFASPCFSEPVREGRDPLASGFAKLLQTFERLILECTFRTIERAFGSLAAAKERDARGAAERAEREVAGREKRPPNLVLCSYASGCSNMARCSVFMHDGVMAHRASAEAYGVPRLIQEIEAAVFSSLGFRVKLKVKVPAPVAGFDPAPLRATAAEFSYPPGFPEKLSVLLERAFVPDPEARLGFEKGFVAHAKAAASHLYPGMSEESLGWYWKANKSRKSARPAVISYLRALGRVQEGASTDGRHKPTLVVGLRPRDVLADPPVSKPPPPPPGMQVRPYNIRCLPRPPSPSTPNSGDRAARGGSRPVRTSKIRVHKYATGTGYYLVPGGEGDFPEIQDLLDKALVEGKEEPKWVGIRSTPGRGKSKSMVRHAGRLLERDPSAKILVITPGTELTADQARAYPGFTFYQDTAAGHVNAEELERGLVTTINSVYRTRGRFDYVFIDELSSVLGTLPWITTLELAKQKEGKWPGKAQLPTCEHLSAVLRAARMVVVADASLSDVDIEAMKVLMGPNAERLILDDPENSPVIGEKGVEWFEGEFRGNYEILEAVEEGDRVAVASMSRTYAANLADALRKRFPSKRIAYYDRERRKEYYEGWEGPISDPFPDVAMRADVLIYTPTIRAGLSLQLPHFDRVFGYVVSKGALAEDLAQMILRIRTFTSDRFSLILGGGSSASAEPEIQTFEEAHHEQWLELVKENRISFNPVTRMPEGLDTTVIFAAAKLREAATRGNVRGSIEEILRAWGATRFTDMEGDEDRELDLKGKSLLERKAEGIAEAHNVTKEFADAFDETTATDEEKGAMDRFRVIAQFSEEPRSKEVALELLRMRKVHRRVRLLDRARTQEEMTDAIKEIARVPDKEMTGELSLLIALKGQERKHGWIAQYFELLRRIGVGSFTEGVTLTTERAIAAEDLVRANTGGTRKLWEIAREFGMEYKQGTFTPLYEWADVGERVMLVRRGHGELVDIQGEEWEQRADDGGRREARRADIEELTMGTSQAEGTGDRDYVRELEQSLL